MVAERLGYRWWVLVNTFLVFTIAIGMGGTYIVMVVAEVLAGLNLKLADWGPLWSAISLGVMLFSIIGGALGDRFGIRLIAGLGIMLAGAFLILRGTASGFATMYTWMFLFGAGAALAVPNVPKALGMWFPPQEFGLANGITLAGNGVGAGLAALLTPLLLESLGGWRNLTYLLGILTMGLGVFWLLTIRDRPLATTDSAAQIGMVEAMRRVLRVRDVWLVAGCYLFFLGGYLGLIGYAPTYFVTVRGMSPATSGVMISVLSWALVVGTFLLPTLSDRVGLRKAFYFPAMLATGIFIMLMAYVLGPSLWIVTILVGFMAGAAAIAFVVPLEMEGVGPMLAGSAVGVAVTAGSLGGVISPLIGMSLVSAKPVAGFVFWGGCYVVSSLLFLLIKETGLRTPKA